VQGPRIANATWSTAVPDPFCTADPPPDDGPLEYKALADWAVDLGWDDDELAAVLAADPGLDRNSPLTADALTDLVGLARCPAADGGAR
jgi:hypothetical protein